MSACRRQYPGRTDGLARSFSPIDVGLPSIHGGSAPASPVSGPAQRSLSLRPTNLPGRLKRPPTPEASAASLPPLLLRLLPGGANQIPGGIHSRCEPAPFHGARESQAKDDSTICANSPDSTSMVEADFNIGID